MSTIITVVLVIVLIGWLPSGNTSSPMDTRRSSGHPQCSARISIQSFRIPDVFGFFAGFVGL